ncbi:MAG: GyrI-like domain-containing protein [Eubacteriaceae bacterium]
MEKHVWRKAEKNIYLPKAKPELIEIPKFSFFTIEGEGNPNLPDFGERVGVLYSLAYTLKMLPKSGVTPKGYFDYTVYPLEGLWDFTEEAKEKMIFSEKSNQKLNFTKDDLAYKIMIRQPEFVDSILANEIIEKVKIKKPHPLLNDVKFESIEDGLSVQMLHVGSYDDEIISFNTMNAFCETNYLEKRAYIHREIYLSDPGKVLPEKLKTTLRYFVKRI